MRFRFACFRTKFTYESRGTSWVRDGFVSFDLGDDRGIAEATAEVLRGEQPVEIELEAENKYEAKKLLQSDEMQNRIRAGFGLEGTVNTTGPTWVKDVIKKQAPTLATKVQELLLRR